MSEKNILTFLELYYRDASLLILYFFVQGISIKKSDESKGQSKHA